MSDRQEGSVTMKKRRILRYLSLGMFLVAVVFVLCALSAPNLGRTIYIGNFKFGAHQWRICYAVYGIIMVSLFAGSFFVKDGDA